MFISIALDWVVWQADGWADFFACRLVLCSHLSGSFTCLRAKWLYCYILLDAILGQFNIFKALSKIPACIRLSEPWDLQGGVLCRLEVTVSHLVLRPRDALSITHIYRSYQFLIEIFRYFLDWSVTWREKSRFITAINIVSRENYSFVICPSASAPDDIYATLGKRCGWTDHAIKPALPKICAVKTIIERDVLLLNVLHRMLDSHQLFGDQTWRVHSRWRSWLMRNNCFVIDVAQVFVLLIV